MALSTLMAAGRICVLHMAVKNRLHLHCSVQVYVEGKISGSGEVSTLPFPCQSLSLFLGSLTAVRKGSGSREAEAHYTAKNNSVDMGGPAWVCRESGTVGTLRFWCVCTLLVPYCLQCYLQLWQLCVQCMYSTHRTMYRHSLLHSTWKGNRI